MWLEWFLIYRLGFFIFSDNEPGTKNWVLCLWKNCFKNRVTMASCVAAAMIDAATLDVTVTRFLKRFFCETKHTIASLTAYSRTFWKYTEQDGRPTSTVFRPVTELNIPFRGMKAFIFRKNTYSRHFDKFLKFFYLCKKILQSRAKNDNFVKENQLIRFRQQIYHLQQFWKKTQIAYVFDESSYFSRIL